MDTDRLFILITPEIEYLPLVQVFSTMIQMEVTIKDFDGVLIVKGPVQLERWDTQEPRDTYL